MATFFFINISSGMRPHTHTQPYTHCERVTRRHAEAGGQRANFSRRHSYGCSANAVICHCLVWSVVPTSLLRVYCSSLSHMQCWGKRGGRPLSSAPFTKQPLWSEARIRMIMWTLAKVYQQVSCSCGGQSWPALGCTVFLHQVHIGCGVTFCLSINGLQIWRKKQMLDLQEFLQEFKTVSLYTKVIVHGAAEGQRESEGKSTSKCYFSY